ncbi:uncharacterized protein PITG_06521 [Phytophthora infestans T30-4]|uniref:EGF-like domain-containing protein n=1 Tax=Phytophthora infestans (strain T30-4) TaxID=403677 RepID=D0N517_PHYIT|nr:uncharacterized protein PITG_06521 [Phytophthora infestans T30-4]EEY69975.1 conserved hypothetical protein [Phytophthora infestans T30-4]|eukprot:XP_002998622.1 conserved hypothetical protein [Phytophthora infestans T30-4]
MSCRDNGNPCVPNMVAFVTLFSQKYKRSTDASLSLAFEWAAKTFRVATKREFEYVAPKLMHQFASMHEEEELSGEQDEGGRPPVPQSPKTPTSPVCGNTRSRSEGDEDERRVRQRIEYANPYVELDLTSEGSTPQKASVVQAGSEGRDDDDTGMARVLERRLELDIMKQSELLAKQYESQRQLAKMRWPPLVLLALLLRCDATDAACARGVYNNKICSGHGACNTRKLCESDVRHFVFDSSQMECASDCNDVGRCVSLKGLSAMYAVGTEPLYDSAWDADMMYGCKCSKGYHGYDCSLKSCPRGDDPMTTGQKNEVQIVQCTGTGGSFFMFFKGQSAEIPFNTKLEDFKTILTTIKTLPMVKVTFGGTATTVCTSGTANPIMIEFIQDFGPQSPIKVLGALKGVVYLMGGSVFATSAGICDRTTVKCPGDPVCSGHGQCMTIRQLSLEADSDSPSLVFDYGTDPNNILTFDRDNILGCKCDPGYEAYDCSKRSCLKGDDPVTTDQVDEIQLIKCIATGGVFRLQYRTLTSVDIPFDVTMDDLRDILMISFGFEDLEVEYSSGTKACSAPGSAENIITIAFPLEHGDIPPLRAETTGLTTSSGAVSVVTADNGAAIGGVVSQKGTKENAVCSNRGYCDYSQVPSMAPPSPVLFSRLAPGTPAAYTALAQAWMTVVNNVESLTPELLDSSDPCSENYSAEDNETFWALVHQGYSAKFDDPAEAEDAQTLCWQWETVRIAIKDFNGILTEIWPKDLAKHLDKLPTQDRHKLLTQLQILYRDRMGESFEYLEVWNLLTHHAKWDRVLKPLILRAAAGHDGEDDSDSDSGTSSEPEGLPVSKDKDTELITEIETRKPLKQSEQTTETVAVTHLTLAWANVCCSWAEMSPRLEESNECFWLHVSSMYLDLVVKRDRPSGIEFVLKQLWYEMRAEIVVFHTLYEEELKGDSSVSRTNRESMVSRAQEAYWSRCGQWFKHRAAWEILERHKDWEHTLKRLLLLGLDKRTSTTDGDASSCKLTGSILQEPTDSHNLEGESDGPGDLVLVPASESSEVSEDVNDGKQKNAAVSEGWLEWNTRLLELQVMTRSEVGLSPEALEYLRLRRQQILEKEQLKMHLSKPQTD